MNKEDIIEVLHDWNFWKKDLDVGVFREEYVEKLCTLARTKQVIAVTGVRRSGKSTLLKQFMKKHIDLGRERKSFLYINLEEPKFVDSLSLDFLQQAYEAYREILQPSETPCLILDEVHTIQKWERFVRGLHEKGEALVLVSGSTSKLLSRELGTLLTGRWLNLTLYPLHFKEFLAFHSLTPTSDSDILSQKTKIRQLLRTYLEFGGFPLVVLQEEKEEILRRYFDDILARDVSEKYKIRNPEKLKTLAKYYLTSFSSLSTYRSIKKFIGLSLDSVERYSSYLSDAHLLFFVPKFSYSLKEQEVNPRKVYCIDLGLVNVVSFRFSENIGRLYENLVFLSLLRQGREIYYYTRNYECDFLVKEGQKITKAIQVSYHMSENKEREIEGLLEAMKEFHLKEGHLITDNVEKEEKIRGKKIVYTPLWKWLLKPS